MLALTNAPPLLESKLPGIPLFKRGKVRDVYDLGDELLLVATDRLSAFDVVLPTGIPGKGIVLTQLSLFWFELLKDVVPNHVRTANVAEYPAALRPFADQLEGRSMLVTKTDVLPVECVVRGYITGSGYKDYKRTGSVCGIALPAGLRDSDRLEPAIFTPATKAETGHDENIPFETMAATVGRERADEARRGRDHHQAAHRRQRGRGAQREQAAQRPPQPYRRRRARGDRAGHAGQLQRLVRIAAVAMPGQVDQVQAEAVRQVLGQRCEHAAVQRPAVDQD